MRFRSCNIAWGGSEVHDRRRGRIREIVHVVEMGEEGPMSGIGVSRWDGIGFEMAKPAESTSMAWAILVSVDCGMEASFGCRRR
jgi:hypothetical protein